MGRDITEGAGNVVEVPAPEDMQMPQTPRLRATELHDLQGIPELDLNAVATPEVAPQPRMSMTTRSQATAAKGEATAENKSKGAHQTFNRIR